MAKLQSNKGQTIVEDFSPSITVQNIAIHWEIQTFRVSSKSTKQYILTTSGERFSLCGMS